MGSFTLFGYSITWMDTIVLLCTLGYGTYTIYTGLRLKKEQHFFQNGILIPKGRTEEECIAPEEYFRFLIPRLLLFGILLILLGIFNFIWPMVVVGISLPYLLGLVGIAPILAVLMLFNMILKKACRDFWP